MTDLRTRFERLRETWLPSILSLIEELVAESSAEESLLRNMMCYQLQTGGKRLRAILPLLVGEALDVDPARLVPFGAACEMLHNASTVHDDIQDGDVARRGHPTIWNQFGMGQAVNLGDAMIAMTILLMQRLDAPVALRERATCRLLQEMLRVIEGQVEDLELRGRATVSLPEYLHMVERKTSRLFALPLSGAALLCGAPEELEAGLVEAACHIGMLFQIQDDILDIYGDKGRGEKGNDIREGKRSFLVVHCMENAPPGDLTRLRQILDKARGATTQEDVAESQEIFERTGSLAFGLDELARRRNAALSVRSLASYPALLEVLDEACGMFLAPMASMLPAGLAARSAA
ncbi:MAG TPA: polyprenyl synthetase family protein [Bryobacteraceae bacterium]|nr:polyprenyl synthetase family protein [Bryobacteraceae bacterium]